MPFSRKLLTPGEEIVLEAHPNWSVLLRRITLAVAVIAGCVAVVVSWSSAPLWVGYILLGVGLLAIAGVLAKVVMWRSTTLVVTNVRVVYRTGVLRRFGREIPLSRVQDVTYRQSIVERMLGAGSLTIESAGQSGQEPFPDIARPAMVQSLINSLMYGQAGQQPGPAGRPQGGARGYSDDQRYASPTAQGYAPPGAPGYAPPPAPGYASPPSPGYAPPGAPGYAPPPAPGYAPPPAPGYGPPGAHGYARSAGPSSDTQGYGPPSSGYASASDYSEPTAQFERTRHHDEPVPYRHGRGAHGVPPSASPGDRGEGQGEGPASPGARPIRWVAAPGRSRPESADEYARSSSEELARLIELNRLGVITDAELVAKRRELLGGQ